MLVTQFEKSERAAAPNRMATTECTPAQAWVAGLSAQVKEKPAERAGDTEPNALSPTLLTVALAASALQTACGGGGGGTIDVSVGTGTGISPGTSTSTVAVRYTSPSSDEDAARFLLQAQFSASDAEIAAVRSKGYATWLQEQFAAPATTTGFDWLNARGYGAINSANFFDASYPGDYMIWNQLMTSSDAVRKRMALALSEFFVVSLTGLEISAGAAMPLPPGGTCWCPTRLETTASCWRT
jgi:uncharacterized protein (DUF1800 family)